MNSTTRTGRASAPSRRAASHLPRVIAATGTAALLGTAWMLNPIAHAAEAEVLHTWTGQLGGDAGSAVSQQACDFTGDGTPDVVAGSWMWERAPYGQIGAAYVIPSDADDGSLDDPTTGVIRIEGPLQQGAMVGFSTNCAGDVNGDGIDDLVITEFVNSRAWVVFGSTDRQTLSLEHLGDRGFIIQGDSDRTGFHATGVGDLDGDGLAEVAVTSLVANDRSGTISIVRGADSFATVDLTASDRVLARIHGGPEQGVSTIAPAGDVNGDGRPDLVVGGYVATPAGAANQATGMAWVVFGPSAGDVRLTQEFDGFTIHGPERGRDRLGMAVHAAGDVDGDGFDDVAIGADPANDVDRPGGVAVVRGAASNATVVTDPTNAERSVHDGEESRGWWLTSAQPGDHAGYSVSAIPAADGTSGTIVFGAWGASEAWAVDTRALTESVVQVDHVDPDLTAHFTGDDPSGRRGRGVGVIAGFGDDTRPMMVVGGSNLNDAGQVSLVALPERGPISPDPTPTPAPTETATPSPSSTPEPSVTPSTTPSASSTPTNPGPTPSPSDSPEPSDSPTAPPSASSTPTERPEPTGTATPPTDPRPSTSPTHASASPEVPTKEPETPQEKPEAPQESPDGPSDPQRSRTPESAESTPEAQVSTSQPTRNRPGGLPSTGADAALTAATIAAFATIAAGVSLLIRRKK